MVYTVYGTLHRNDFPDYNPLASFTEKDAAVDYAIHIARKAFDALGIPAKDRECNYYENSTDREVMWIGDIEDYDVDIFVWRDRLNFPKSDEELLKEYELKLKEE